MVIIFAEKLNILMRLTSTTNSRLASAISVDPSLISKLRSGVRSVSSKSDYLLPMSAYFGSKCTDSYRSLTLLELIGADFGGDVVSALVNWFLDDEKTINISYPDEVAPSGFGKKKTDRIFKEKFFYFHGVNAMSEATEFMKELLNYSETVKTVKIFFNCSGKENVQDLFSTYDNLWNELIENGTEIIRIFPEYYDLFRNVRDTLEWLPLISSGKVKSFYFKDFRSFSANSSMVVVPGVAALFSSSAGGIGPTFVTTEKAVVEDCNKMFDSYISFCDEGSKTELCSGNTDAEGLFEEFLEIEDDLCNVFDSLPYEWTPEGLFPDGDLLIRKHSDKIKKLLKTNTVTEIFPLLSPLEIADGKAFCCAEGKKRAYTVSEYSKHLEAVVELLENEPNYRVIISANIDSVNPNICIKKNGSIVKLPEIPKRSYGMITHKPSVNAMHQYYMNRYYGFPDFEYSKEKVIIRLKNLISELKKAERA